MQRNREELALWLFDLAHGNMSDQQILQGFIKHYVLCNLCIGNVQDDLKFRTTQNTERMQAAMTSLQRVLQVVSRKEITQW